MRNELICGVKLIKTFRIFGNLFLTALALIGCTKKYHAFEPAVNAGIKQIDYGQLYNWAAHPQKADPSDSIPFPLQTTFMKDTTVDVFFIHPTSYTGKKSIKWNADLSDAELNSKTDQSSILYQASVFNKYNIYAPRYRQAHLRSYFSSDTAHAGKALEIAYEDVRTAFKYFLEHENKGKPIIIASHSQGTTHAKRLLKEFFENQPLQKQLVAAYIIGMQVEPDYFTGLEPCRDSLQTGCFIAWRTFRRGYEPPYKPSARKSFSTNPLTWKTDTAYAPARYNKGSVLFKFNTVIPSVNDAQIYKDLLWISRPDFPGSIFFRRKNYHIGDINLFYLNIRENLNLRVTQYRLKN
jgi:Protein of unknown function (DUF3089)